MLHSHWITYIKLVMILSVDIRGTFTINVGNIYFLSVYIKLIVKYFDVFRVVKLTYIIGYKPLYFIDPCYVSLHLVCIFHRIKKISYFKSTCSGALQDFLLSDFYQFDQIDKTVYFHPVDERDINN